MYRVFTFAILMISALGCRTSINLAVKNPTNSSIDFAENAEEPVAKQHANTFPLLTEEQSQQLQDRFSRHQTEAMDVKIVSSPEYECKSDDWICTESSGARTCYCKAAKVEK